MKTLIIVMLFFVSLQSKAENIQDHFEIEQILLPEEFIVSENIYLCENNGSVYAIYFDDISNDTIKLSIFSKTINVKVDINHDIIRDIDRRGTIESVDLNINYLTILYSDRLIIVKHDNYQNFKIDNIIKLTEFYDDLLLFEDKIILTVCALNSSKIPVTGFSVYEFEEKILVDYSVAPPAGIELSVYQPKHNLTTNEYFVAISDIVNYRIKLYDMKNNFLDSISKEPFNQDLAEFYDFITTNNNKGIRKYIEEIGHYHRNLRQIIKSIFLNDTTLLIYWTDDTRHIKNEYYFDLWIYNQNEWQVYKENLNNYKPKMEDLCQSKFPIPNSFNCVNNLLFFTVPIPIDLYSIHYVDKTFKELETVLTEYYIEHNLRYSILVYHYKGK